MLIFRSGLKETASRYKGIPGNWEYAFNSVHSYSNIMKI